MAVGEPSQATKLLAPSLPKVGARAAVAFGLKCAGDYGETFNPFNLPGTFSLDFLLSAQCSGSHRFDIF